MVPTDLVFWIAPIESRPSPDARLLCQRHADAMVVPRGWTLDDRREGALRLFSVRVAQSAPADRVRRRVRQVGERPEQLQIDGTGEIARPDTDSVPDAVDDGEAPTEAPTEAVSEWQPAFDHDDDLGGLLEVDSPLLARAFRGTDRPRR